MEPKTGENPLIEQILQKAEAHGLPLNSPDFAALLDRDDPLAKLREEFNIPQHQGRPVVYLVGNSLGLQPKLVPKLIAEELQVWAEVAINGHFEHPYGRPWFTVDEECANLLLPIVGAGPGEVAAMGSLTENLHLLLCAFYQPTPARYKIVMESKAFPSDHVHFHAPLSLLTQLNRISLMRAVLGRVPDPDAGL